MKKIDLGKNLNEEFNSVWRLSVYSKLNDQARILGFKKVLEIIWLKNYDDLYLSLRDSFAASIIDNLIKFK